jgi:predicted dehydrogenase
MKLLFVGLGGAGQRHLRNFRSIMGGAAAYTAYRVRRAPAVIGEDFKVIEGAQLDIPGSDSLEAALAGRPDAVVISNPTSEHTPVALAAARAGAHVLIEKPLSNNMECLAELERALAERSRIGLVGYMMRFHPALRQIRDWLNAGRIGDVFSARFEAASYVPDWHPWEDYRNLYAMKRALGGGVVLTESHELDLALWFFGRPRRVFALGGAFSGKSGDVEDTASILLDCGFPVHIQLCFMQRPPSRSCEINGASGRIVWAGGNSLRLFDSHEWTSYKFDGCERADLFEAEARHFLACIEGTERPAIDVQAGAASLQAALAALHSIDTGEAVEL